MPAADGCRIRLQRRTPGAGRAHELFHRTHDSSTSDEVYFGSGIKISAPADCHSFVFFAAEKTEASEKSRPNKPSHRSRQTAVLMTGE
jgi:hypothetical protein